MFQQCEQNLFYWAQPYMIQQYDTLYSISQRFGVSIEAIVYANPGIDPYNLLIGQIICIPSENNQGAMPPECTLALKPNTYIAPDVGGVLWLRREISNETNILIAVGGIPAELDETGFTAVFSWGNEKFTMDLYHALGPHIWGCRVGIGHNNFPYDFYKNGKIEIVPGPILTGMIKNCR